jgi:hypothetical protein
VPCLRRLVAASHRSGPGWSMWDLWWTKWHWDKFFSKFFSFPCQCYSTMALHTHIIWGMNNRPTGSCSSQTEVLSYQHEQHHCCRQLTLNAVLTGSCSGNWELHVCSMFSFKTCCMLFWQSSGVAKHS